MFFDTLAGIVERHLPEFVPLLKDARIFRLEPRDPNMAVGHCVEQWSPDERTVENFRLPFPAVVFEHTETRTSPSDACVVLSVKGKPEERKLGYFVAMCDRDQEVWIAAGSLHALPNVEQELQPGCLDRVQKPNSIRMWRGSKKAGVHPVAVDLGMIDPDYDRLDKLEIGNEWQRVQASYHKNEITIEEVNRYVRDRREELESEMISLRCNLTNSMVTIGVLGVLIVNEPARFVVEERPLIPVKENPNLVVPRSVGRPHYVVLEPRQIRKRFIYPTRPELEDDDETESRRKVGAHERRGHFRRLSAERFKNARGRVLWIDPIWVGPSEAVRGPNKYTVRLDL